MVGTLLCPAKVHPAVPCKGEARDVLPRERWFARVPAMSFGREVQSR